MRASRQGVRALTRLSGMKSVGLFLVAGMAFSSPASAQKPYTTQEGEMLLFESAGAAPVVEKVRSKTQGVMEEVFVKVGDPVLKDQLLGHADLEATKLQVDLARENAESTAKLDAAESQAEAWTVTREEIQEAVRKRDADESRLKWARAMERMYHAQYEAQVDARKIQRVQLDYWQRQYEHRFFRSPVDGVVTEVKVEIGKPFNIATHVFTVSSENTYVLPVVVPRHLAENAVTNESVHVRSADGKSVSRALIDSVIDDPRGTGAKIMRLFVNATDLSAVTRAHLAGMRFDVLLPRAAQPVFR